MGGNRKSRKVEEVEGVKKADRNGSLEDRYDRAPNI